MNSVLAKLVKVTRVNPASPALLGRISSSRSSSYSVCWTSLKEAASQHSVNVIIELRWAAEYFNSGTLKFFLSPGKQHSQADGPPLLPHWLNTMLGEIFQSPCPTKPEPYLPDSRVTFTGSGSPAQCESLIKTLFNCSACAGKPECSFDGVYQPSVHGNFFVILWHPWAAVFTAFIPVSLLTMTLFDVQFR